MIAALLALVLVSPRALERISEPERRVFSAEECIGGQIVCPFARSGRYCVCAPAEINLGEWDPRPNAEDWDHYNYPLPPAYGAYPTEKTAKTDF